MPVLATPFTDHGDVDLASLRRLLEFEVSAGVDGVAVFGFASEGFTLTDAERRDILEVVTDVVGPEMPVIAGVGATGTRKAIEQCQAAAAAGASVAMVLPPYMVKPGPAQIVDFYGEVAAAGGLSVMVQDAPGSTGVTMPVPLIVELSKLDGVDSIKVETQPTVPKIGAVVAATTPDFIALGGQNALFVLEEYARGAIGTMPACEFADVLAPVLASWNDGDLATARSWFNLLLPLIRFGLQPGIAWSIHKHVLVRRGVIDSAMVRPPAVEADPFTISALELILSDLGIS
jgi:4-hydroxy-tetrahydrodipicolinate synthase